MSIKTQLTTDMKEAMRAQDKPTLQTIRLILAAIQRKAQDEKDNAIKKGLVFKELTEEQIIQTVQTFKKQSEETLEGFQTRGDTDKVVALQEEIRVTVAYLPKQLSKEEVKRVIASTTLTDIGSLNKGTLMKAIMPVLKGKADNKTIGEAVDEWLKV